MESMKSTGSTRSMESMRSIKSTGPLKSMRSMEQGSATESVKLNKYTVNLYQRSCCI